MKKVIVVESPIKAKTIQKYLNEAKANAVVIASGGHIKDLSRKTMSIEIKNKKFIGHYEVLHSAKPFIKQLNNYLKDNVELFICTDDDREGERICEDIIDTCHVKSYYRYAPREIIKETIIEAIVHKVGIRQINEEAIAAQRARREIDRIIGYGMSPVIRWYAKENSDQDIKTQGTGRVEAIALSILYERHKQIEAYKTSTPPPTDAVKATYKFNGIPFDLMGEKLEFKKTENEELEKAKAIARNNPHVVTSVTPDLADVEPPPPLITSRLYSAASYSFGFEPEKTKKLAQELFYSGVINYPRTDSYTIADEKVREIIRYLENTISIERLEDIKKEKREYKNKKGAQAAHEAIRPAHIDIENSPSKVRDKWKYDPLTSKLNDEHFKLYELIWMYTVSTQLEDACYDRKEVVVRAGDLTFKDKANKCIKQGWQRYYGLELNESAKDDKEAWKKKEKILPELTVGQVLDHVTIDSYEKQSRVPKRISMGMLISQLETLQVARPSTMHTISAKIIGKGYATSYNTLFTLTHSGIFVAKFNDEFAHELTDRKKAAQFEETIQKVEDGEITDTNSLLQENWDLIETVKKRVGFIEVEDRKPTIKQKELIESITKDYSDSEKKKLPANLKESFSAASKFISEQKEKEKKEALNNTIGVCPKCKKETIVSKGEIFTCLTDKCDFVLFKKNLLKFFSSMKKELDNGQLSALVSVLLKDKVVFVTGLNTQFGTQDTYFKLKYNRQYKSYSLSFVKKSEVQDAAVGLWEDEYNNKKENMQQAVEATKKAEKLSEEIKQLQQKNRRLLEERRKDTLTRAYNLTALNEDLSVIIKNKDHKRVNNKIFVCFLDGDHFKEVNDTYGHDGGDDALKGIVDTFYLAFRHYEVNGNIYRKGGDEFVVLFYGIEEEYVASILNMTRRSISSKKFGSKNVTITISTGYAQYKDGDSASVLIDMADAAMYEAKKNRNSIASYSNSSAGSVGFADAGSFE